MKSKKTQGNISAIILAAGKSTRMKTSQSKVLHTIRGQESILYTLQAACKLANIRELIVVVGHKKEDVTAVIKEKLQLPKNVKLIFVDQKEQKGTAHAVRVALPSASCGTIMILCGDSPLISPETLTQAEIAFFDERFDGLVLTTLLDDPASYGRIIRDEYGKMIKITETRDLPAHERHRFKEVNSGMYFLDKKKARDVLHQVKENENKNEFYLTDLVEIFNKKRYNMGSFVMDDPTEMLSVNTLEELSDVDRIMNQRLIRRLMRQGVRFIDPENTYISHDTVIGADTVIYPFVYIGKRVAIGSQCNVGPFIHLRDSVILEDNVTVGNFLEIARSRIQSSSKAKHFGYLGDVDVGKNVNIGAGTVVANYDGKNKNKTMICDGAFIGSDSILVAPLTIGKNALTGAGSVVTKDVPEQCIVVGVPAKQMRKR